MHLPINSTKTTSKKKKLCYAISGPKSDFFFLFQGKKMMRFHCRYCIRRINNLTTNASLKLIISLKPFLCTPRPPSPSPQPRKKQLEAHQISNYILLRALHPLFSSPSIQILGIFTPSAKTLPHTHPSKPYIPSPPHSILLFPLQESSSSCASCFDFGYNRRTSPQHGVRGLVMSLYFFKCFFV